MAEVDGAAELPSPIVELRTLNDNEEICGECRLADALVVMTDRCRKERGRMNVELKLGTLGHVSQKRGCPICQAITKFFTGPQFRDMMEEYHVPGPDSENPVICLRSCVNFPDRCFNFRPRREGQKLVDLRLFLRDVDEGLADFMTSPLGACWCLYFPDRIWAEEDIGRLYSPSYIDIPGIKRWLCCCDAHHPDCRSDLPDGGKPFGLRSMYFIDLEDDCLATSSGATRYAALSYVWGGVNQLQLIRKNLKALKQSKSLSQDSTLAKIPQTIRDAMSVTKALGIRYLWVDALCIVQDDYDSKCVHLQAMASIYAAAYVTIVAAEGSDASYGIRGVNGSLRHHSVTNQQIPFPSSRLFANFEPLLLSTWPEGSAWVGRAWTLQESLFSRRLLIFNGLVHWICRTDQWREGIESRTKGETQFSIIGGYDEVGLTKSAPYFPDLIFWADLVEKYNHRKLTFSSDILNAFAGITRELSPSFPGGFHYGLPEMFFDIALLWQPKGAIKRREADSQSGRVRLFGPSWSWVGWEGNLDLENWTTFADHILPNTNFEGQLLYEILFGKPYVELVNTPKWRKITATRKFIPVDACWQALKPNKMEVSQFVSPRWTECWNTDAFFGEILTPSSCYQLESEPAHASLGHDARFRYPIPLTSSSSEVLGESDTCTFLLIARLSKASFKLGPLPKTDTDEVPFVNDEGHNVGSIRLNQHNLPNIHEDEGCDLIAISDGRFWSAPCQVDKWVTKFRECYWRRGGDPTNYNHLEEVWPVGEWEPGEKPWSREYYEFVNVLWIEQRGQIAYRKALGKVMKSAWERKKPEIITVVLG